MRHKRSSNDGGSGGNPMGPILPGRRDIPASKSIKNPLTMIGVFSSLAEVAGTAVLPLVPASLQSTYIWFLMGFPVLLVLLFFGTLLFRHRVLYAPSDFADEKDFMRLLHRASPREVKLQRTREVEEAAPTSQVHPAPALSIAAHDGILVDAFLSQKLALERFAQDRNVNLETDMAIGTSDNKVIFDAAYADGQAHVAIEVRFVRENLNRAAIQTSLDRLNGLYAGLSDADRRGFRLVLIIVKDGVELTPNQRRWLADTAAKCYFPVEILSYTYAELRQLVLPLSSSEE